MKRRLTPTTDARRRIGAARGFTLAESLIAATVLAVVVAAIVQPVALSYENTQTADELTVAASLARQLMDEIASKPFVDPSNGSIGLGPGADEPNRQAFDNIDDYYNYSDSTASMKRLDGTALSLGLTGTYTRNVYAEFRQTPNGSAKTSGDFIMVRVTVVTPGGQSVKICRLFANYPRGN